MNTHADKTQENKSHSLANTASEQRYGSEATFQFVDNRPEIIAQRKMQKMADNFSGTERLPFQRKERNKMNTRLERDINVIIPQPSNVPVQGRFTSDSNVVFQLVSLRGKDGVISSGDPDKPMDRDTGHRLLARLAKGDFSAFEGLSGAPPHSEIVKQTFDNVDDFLVNDNPTTQEWGLAVDDQQEVHLISGKGKAVSWGVVLDAGGTPEAHSHPYSGSGLTSPKRSINKEDTLDAIILNDNSRNLVLPSEGDVAFCAHQKLVLHTVFTPYVCDPKTKLISNPEDRAEGTKKPRLVFQIRDAQLLDHDNIATAHLDARVNTHLIWTSKVRCPADGTSSTNFEFS